MDSSGPGGRKPLGRILLQQKAVSPKQLDELLAEQKAHPGQRLASVAASSGKVGEVDLLKALSEQHGVPGIDLAQVVVPLENLRLVPLEIAKQHAILPLLVKDERLFLAMADPADKRVVDEIEFVTGRRVFPYVALHEPLSKLIDECYRLLEHGETYFIGPSVPPEYLAQLGIQQPERPPQSPPRPKTIPPDPVAGSSSGVVLAPNEDDAMSEADLAFAGLLDDDDTAAPMPIAKLPKQAAALDPAFQSRVAPLPTEEPPRAPERPKSGKPKVLVVDDEEDIRRLLRRVLTERGFEVVEATTGFDALTKVRDEMPDVILLDAMLPEVHGFDICRRIKGSKRYGHIPIIMVSAVYRGWRFARDLEQSYGVTAFLEKPFKIGDVVAAVERARAGTAQPSPEDPDALSKEAREALTRGISAFERGDLDAAVEQLREGIAIDPLAFRLHYHLGLLLGRKDGALFEAIQALETAVDLAPRSFSALKNLAVLYQRAGFRHRAVELWERALAAAPDDETRRGIKEHLVGLL